MSSAQVSGPAPPTISPLTHLERLRAAELQRIRKYLPSGGRILELGGGNGYQAAILSTWGHQVTAIDVALPLPGFRTYFPVSTYDGKSLDYETSSFDAVFSSNVLEHVKDLAPLMAECKRVLRREGIAIHILPSPCWRFWTGLTHYAHILMRAIGMRTPVSEGVVLSVSETIQQRGAWDVFRRALVVGPHGEYPSALSEIYYFSKHRWMKVFREQGFDVMEMIKIGIFYTGYELLPELSIERREQLAAILGSATYAFVLRPR